MNAVDATGGKKGLASRREDVARRANVSVMTVTRALLQPEKVAEATRDRIERAIREVGYIPNLVARSLASNQTNLVAAVIPTMENSLFARTLRAMSETLRQQNLHLMVYDSGYSLEQEETIVSVLVAQRPRGAVLHNTAHSANAKNLLRSAGIPIVETGDLTKRPLDSVVSYSNFSAGRAMAEYLVGRGYRTIAFACVTSRHNDRLQLRRRGFASALREAGRKFDQSLMIEVEAGFAGGARAISALLEGRPDIDAVWFAGGVLPVGALFECQRCGWDVPGRVAIAGYDEDELSTQCVPPLTTMRIPRHEIGRLAATVLLDRFAGRMLGPVRIDLGFEVVPRESA